MPRYKLTLEYNGTPFSGYQLQPGHLTVQGAVQEAIFSLTFERVVLQAAGRTDAGVHARGQVVHMDLEKPFPTFVLEEGLRGQLRTFFHKLDMTESPVTILKAEEVPPTFHARFSAIKRQYCYRILNQRSLSPLRTVTCWHVIKPLDVGLMQRAADRLIGTHDFTTFRARKCQGSTPIKTLDLARFDQQGEEISFWVESRSFLHHQVRNMVGSLVWLGQGNWSFDTFLSAFEARDRTRGGPTAPPQGLCLEKVFYIAES